MSRPLQFGIAVFLLALLIFPVVFTFETWSQLATFVTGVVVVGALFVFGKRWMDGRT